MLTGTAKASKLQSEQLVTLSNNKIKSRSQYGVYNILIKYFRIINNLLQWKNFGDVFARHCKSKLKFRLSNSKACVVAAAMFALALSGSVGFMLVFHSVHCSYVKNACGSIIEDWFSFKMILKASVSLWVKFFTTKRSYTSSKIPPLDSSASSSYSCIKYF